MKKYIKYILLFMISLSILILFEASSPKKINWSPSFSLEDKIPFGNYVLYNIAPDLFPNKKIIPIYYSIHDTFKKKIMKNNNYIFTSEIFALDKYDYAMLDNLVKNGSHAFIAAHIFSGELGKKFNLRTAYPFENMHNVTNDIKVNIILLNKKLNKKFYTYKQQFVAHYFSSFPKNAIVLGMTSDRKANFIKINHGKGAYILSTIPHVFTNYNMLQNSNWEYASSALSCLPVRNTWWDEYYKPKTRQAQTPLRFILTNESLSWAYYLALGTIMLFLVFKGKRRQRIIPVIKPLPNDTLEFVATVGRLYYERKDHRNIALKRINSLFDYIKTKFYFDTSRSAEKDYKKIAEKCDVNLDTIKELFLLIRTIQAQDVISEKKLLLLNKHIETFYLNSKK